jgi:hypothetical protein
MANYMAPKLSQSNLAYRDLLFDPATNRVRIAFCVSLYRWLDVWMERWVARFKRKDKSLGKCICGWIDV